MATVEGRMQVSENDHTLHRIIEHERAQAEHHKAAAESLRLQIFDLAKQHLLICAGFSELMAILDHAGIELNSEILTSHTWAIVMELRLRRDG